MPFDLGNTTFIADTLSKKDSISIDSVSLKNDTANSINLEYKLKRHAEDSIVQNLKNKMVYLYGKAEINYGNINLKAAYISINFNNKTVFAKGIKDSTGKEIGIPVFKQGNETFKAKTLRYDFITKKGIIKDVVTKQGEGYLQGNKVKRMNDNSINIKNGFYTTCPLPNPDYEFKFTKARVIPNKLIVTGPVYMEIEGIPLPMALPFGIFPNNPKRKSGLILPSYGESANRGFYFQGLGYFWYINDYFTFKITGDLYTGGSWQVSPVISYRKRYKYSGNLSLGFARNVISTKGAPDYSSSRDFRIAWSHSQDAKARPNSTFSANVNIISSNYVKYNIVNVNDYLSNQFNSSVAYQRSWDGKYFLTVNASQSQNTLSHQVQVTLPQISFSVNRFYPFRKKNSTRKSVLSDLSISYNMNLQNTINATDSTFFQPETFLHHMQNGVIHNIPITLPLKVLKYFTLSTSVKITDRMYAKSLRQRWVNDSIIINGVKYYSYAKTDTISGFNNLFDYSVSTSLSTKLYGMLKFKKGPVRAIRHVITPSIGFSYTPDFGNSSWGYTGRYVDSTGRVVTYSKYQGFVFGAPPMRKSGSINFTIANNLEIKVPSKKDTITGLKKIPLIENFTVSGNYNLAADSMAMSDIYLSGRTTLTKGLTIQYSGILSPYAVNSQGQAINKYQWQVNRRLLRMTNSTWNVGFNFSLSQKDFEKKKKESKAKADSIPAQSQISQQPQNFNRLNEQGSRPVDWKVPWSFSFNYNFTYSNVRNFVNPIWSSKKTLIQTLGFNGQVSLTQNWKVSVMSGWDFTNNQLSYTSVQLNRNLHCWEMSFSWIPLGPRKSWFFTLRLKAALLKDLKLTKRKDFRDSY